MATTNNVQLKIVRKPLSAVILSLYVSLPYNAFAQDDAEPALEEVIVTGFKASLQAALDTKRNATGQVDAIMAEDIADFPDLNLAESLQRVPGIAITRVNGEGKQITVRGLSGRYTMVRINGMETRAGDGNNNSRAFDFNLFASELFNSLVVRKTASANVSEGSLGPVIDLNTGRPFNYDEGNTFLVRGTLSHNSNSEETMPRIAGLYAYNDPEGKWGASASLAYSETSAVIHSSDSVRWQKARFASVGGVPCAANAADETDPGCLEVRQAFHPRIPRYGHLVVDQERLGITGSLQYAPSEATEITLDVLHAQLNRTRDYHTLEVLFRGNENRMDVTDYVLESNPDRFDRGNNSITSMSVDNAWVRSETYFQEVESQFQQYTLAMEHDFSDSLRLNALLGSSSNEGHMPRVTTLMYDDRDYNGYSYDYQGSGDTLPSLSFSGDDVTDGSNFFLTELRDQVHTTKVSFDTASVDLAWDINEALTLSGGILYKKFEMDTEQDRRDGSVCGLGLYDCDVDDDGEDDLIGAPGAASLTNEFRYDGDVGAGSNRVWASPSLGAWTSRLALYDVPLSLDAGRHRQVEEESLGIFLQLNGEHELSSKLRLLYDLGVRQVETDQVSRGYRLPDWFTIDRPKYKDTLPSMNVALWFGEDIAFRTAWAEVLSRPALSQLSPGATVDSFNYEVDFQNALLDPSRATNFDASIEWFFKDDALLSFAYFTKEIESFAIRESSFNTFASTGLPTNVIAPTSPASQSLEGDCGQPEGCWEISTLVNGPGAEINGIEIATQFNFAAFFENLPPVIDGMGLIANYTYVDSDVEYDFSGNQITAALLELSENQYNVTLYYENDTFGARLSAAYRSEYYESGPNRSGNLWQISEPYLQYDFSSSYHVNDSLSLSLEIVNLLNEPFQKTVDEEANRLLEYSSTGRNVLLSATYKF